MWNILVEEMYLVCTGLGKLNRYCLILNHSPIHNNAQIQKLLKDELEEIISGYFSLHSIQLPLRQSHFIPLLIKAVQLIQFTSYSKFIYFTAVANWINSQLFRIIQRLFQWTVVNQFCVVKVKYAAQRNRVLCLIWYII